MHTFFRNWISIGIATPASKYPDKLVNNGTGSTNVASSFVCKHESHDDLMEEEKRFRTQTSSRTVTIITISKRLGLASSPSTSARVTWSRAHFYALASATRLSGDR